MKTPTLPYPKHSDLSSGKTAKGVYRVAYQDISTDLVNIISTITISKGHRLISGFFGFGILIAGILDRVLEITDNPLSFTAVFGLFTSVIMIIIFITRIITISQLNKLLAHHLEEKGYSEISSNMEVKKELEKLEQEKYFIRIPTPIVMLKGVEFVPKNE